MRAFFGFLLVIIGVLTTVVTVLNVVSLLKGNLPHPRITSAVTLVFAAASFALLYAGIGLL